MEDKILFDRMLSGLVSNETNRAEVAKEVKRNIGYFANMSVPGAKADDSYLSVLTLFGEYENHRRVAEVACKYNEQTGGFVDQDILGQVLKSRGLEPKEITSMMFLFDVCSKEPVEETSFRFWVRELVDHARSVPLAESLANAMQALESQYVDPASSVIYRGPDAAMELIDHARMLPGMVDQNIHSMPSGNIREELSEILQESDEAAAGIRPAGTIYSGFKFIDDSTGGFTPGDFILVGAYTGEGKTVKRGSFVFDPKAGKSLRIGIDEIRSIAGLDHNKIKSGFYKKLVESGVKKCLEVETNLGSFLEPAISHPMLKLGGFVRADKLKVGDYVACVASLPFEDNDPNEFSLVEAKLLGYFPGDGSTGDRKGCSVGVHANVFELGIREEIKSLYSLIGIPTSLIREIVGESNATFIKVDQRNYEALPEEWRQPQLKGTPRKVSPLLQLLRRAEFTGLTPHTKHIPKPVWKFNCEKLKHFLARLWVTDGHFSYALLERGIRQEVAYTTVSKRLAYELRILLLKLGIRTRLRKRMVTETKSKKKFLAYEVKAAYSADAIKICQLPLPEKQGEAAWLVERLENNSAAKEDCFPKEVWSIIKSEWEKAGKPRGSHPPTSCKNYVAGDEFGSLKFTTSKKPTRRLIRRWANILQSKVLFDLVESEILWERVTSVKDIGEHPCFDIGNSSVNNTFIAGTFITHNSQFAGNCAWFAAIEQGRNVLVITLETARGQYRRRILCRHSNKPSVGKIGGILYKNVKTGQFSDKQEKELWVKVVQDFCTNPGYGVLDITQATEGMTIEEVSAKARSFEDRHGVPLHMIVVDYLALMGAKRARKGRQEELNDILREAKGFSTSFDNGRGVVFMAPHQTKQARREIVRPESGKFYTVRDYSDTSEAGKTIDVGIMLLRTEELEEVHELAASLVKCRDAEAPPQVVRLYERYSSSFIGNLSSTE